MLESYGGIVTRMNLRYVEGCGAAALIALLGRQKRVAEVTVEREKVIPALCPSSRTAADGLKQYICGFGTL